MKPIEASPLLSAAWHPLTSLFSLERILQVNMTVAVILGTVLLGMGQSDPLPPLVAMIGGAVSLVVTDAFGWFRLHPLIAIVAAIAALTLTLVEFHDKSSPEQLLVMANLLVYLQLALFFQEKTRRIYWQMAVVSLLQVVVAAASRQNADFGLTLAVYLFAMLSALALLHVWREAGRLVEQSDDIDTHLRRRRVGARGAVDWSPLTPPLVASEVTAEKLAQPWVGRRFVRHIAAMAVATVAVTLLVFIALPRHSEPPWGEPNNVDGGLVAGLDSVRLGDEYGVLELGDEVVLRASFSEGESWGRMKLKDRPYFRGAALSHYDPFASTFSQGHQPWRNTRRWLAPPPRDDGVVRQELTLQPNSSPALFAVFPAYRHRRTDRQVQYSPLTESLTRRQIGANPDPGPFPYTLLTTVIDDGRLASFTPHRNPLKTLDDKTRYETQWGELLRLDGSALAPLTEAAERVVTVAGVSIDDPYAVARALEAHFHAPGSYRYTLDFRQTPLRPANLDPIVHFVENHRSGHCEYFAGALALMLRSQGIPSRIISGYVGGEFNPIGRYYEVRQSHAHTWVEAWLRPHEVPEEHRDRDHVGPAGAWLRLEPTPANDAPPAAAPMSPGGDAWAYVQVLWDEYVLGLNSKRQSDGIYRPLMDRIVALLGQPVSKPTWSGWIFDRFGGSYWRRWLWITLLVVVAAVVVVFARRAIVRLIRRRRPRASMGGSGAPKEDVEFYQQLERLLGKCKLRREAGQTPNEFAAVAARRLESDAEGAVALESLQRLVKIYYRIRFGGVSLSSDLAEQMNADLSRVRKSLMG